MGVGAILGQNSLELSVSWGLVLSWVRAPWGSVHPGGQSSLGLTASWRPELSGGQCPLWVSAILGQSSLGQCHPGSELSGVQCVLGARAPWGLVPPWGSVLVSCRAETQTQDGRTECLSSPQLTISKVL